jgi:hypothetical protein
MKINKKLCKTLSLVLLLVFSFSFAHCELDQFKAKQDDHAQHDYSHLVKETIVPNSQADNEHIEEVKIIRTLPPFYIENIDLLFFKVDAPEFNFIFYNFKNPDIIIITGTFLI